MHACFPPRNQALGTGSCLIAAVLATVASRTLILSGHDIQILGHVPSGMPSFAVPKRGYSGDLSELGSVITSCVPVAFLAFMSLWSVAKKYAEKLGHADLDPNQEAFALGEQDRQGKGLLLAVIVRGDRRDAVFTA